MKGQHFSRRDFLKLSAVAGGSFALSSLVGAAPQLARAADTAPLLHAPQPAFTPLPTSQLTFGKPADISMGWDGTLWAIDSKGALHLYDPIQKQWQPHGEGVDAVAYVGGALYCFHGDAFVTVTNLVNAPTAGPKQGIATIWPSLPASFQLGVTGAANVGGTLYLFKGGLYVNAGDAPATTLKLTDLAGWPSASAWQGGVIDAVYGDGSAAVALFRGGQYILADLGAKKVTSGPQPISAFPVWQSGQVPADQISSGIDGAAGNVLAPGNGLIFNGVTSIVYDQAGDPADLFFIPELISNWPSDWLPQLKQAPSGRLGASQTPTGASVGKLWAVTTANTIVRHDGDNWNQMPGLAVSVAAGADDSAFIVGADTTSLSKWSGADWQPVATSPAPLSQVAAGDASRVWVRESGNGSVGNVRRLTGSAISDPVVEVGQVAHMAANQDGTVWHCNTNNANAYRLISEGQDPSTAIPISSVNSVTKVASTGFGSAHCLTDQGVYTYDSPYVFKTSATYDALDNRGVTRIAVGAGKIFFTVEVAQGNTSNFQAYVVALDAHTGQQAWQTAVSALNVRGTMPVYDPNLGLVYVASAPADSNDRTSPGWIIAIDATTGVISWASSKASDGTPITGIDAPPALSGMQLCFGDRSGRLHMFDTNQALADDKSGKGAQAAWSIVGTGEDGWDAARLSTPTIANGQIYFSAWDYFTGAGLAVYPMQCDAQDGSGLIKFNVSSGSSVPLDISTFVPAPPVLGQASFDGGKMLSPAAFISSYLGATSAIFALSLENSAAHLQFAAPQPQVGTAYFTSGLNYDQANGVVYVGDNLGRLFALNNTSLQPTLGTPLQVSDAIVSTPILYEDPNGQVTVYFGTIGSSTSTNASLYAFDVADKNLGTIATGQTAITTLSNVSNGVIYAAGSFFGGNALGQAFGIRVSEIEQALRDFIIESQLMQDFDEPPQGQTDPPATARYQTHLTIVNDYKAPRPFEPVKIWPDDEATLSIDGGAPVTIDPNDPDPNKRFVAAQTGGDGSLTIVSDADDLFATPLRAWAGFMDPYERIVIYPDTEFHDRVMATKADPNADPNNPDPDQVNLSQSSDYSSAPLFTDDEQKQQQPTHIANAIGAMHQSLGISSSSPGSSFTRRAARADITADPYIAYNDLPGANYFAADTPSTRIMPILAPAGFSYAISTPNDTTSPRAFNMLSHADATAAIDALDGEPWTPSFDFAQDAGVGLPPLLGGFASFFKNLWKHLKSVATTITHIVISVGKEIYLGIRWVENNVVKFFKNTIKFVEDAVAAVGAFFRQLLKDIEKVIEALSVLFHLEEILKTKHIIDGMFANATQTLEADISTGKAKLDTFFEGLESKICNLFNDLRVELDPTALTRLCPAPSGASSAGTLGAGRLNAAGTKPITSLNGMGKTSHDAYNVGPTGSTTKSSHAVQCNWATHKLKQNYQQATTPATQESAVNSDPLTDFFTAFVQRLETDPTLSAAFKQTGDDLKHLFHINSAEQFFTQAITVFLDIVEDVLISGLAVLSAFGDGLLSLGKDLADGLINLGNVHIPILSLLCKGLTFMDVVTFIVAIPVTLIYRVLTGHYPSAGVERGLLGDSLTTLQIVSGIAAGVLYMIAGFVTAILDTLGIGGNSLQIPILPKVLGAILLLLAVGNQFYRVATGKNRTKEDWQVWSISLMSLVLSGASAFIKGSTTGIGKGQQWFASLINALWGIILLTDLHSQYKYCNGGSFPCNDDSGNPVERESALIFASQILATIPTVVNPIKLLPVETLLPILAPIADAVCRVGAGALMMIDVVTKLGLTSPSPLPRRYYFPFVPVAR